jgi:hypothetical protein
MTQASNLAKGGTNFNSTGNLSLTTGVTGILPVANGGTGTSTGVAPGGSTTQVQYNNAGAFGGSANLTYDGNSLTIIGSTGNGYAVQSNGSTAGATVLMTQTQTSNYTWRMAVGGGDNAWVSGRGWFLRDDTAGATRLVVDTSGNVQLFTASTSLLNSSGRKILNQTGGVLQVLSTTKIDTFSTNSASYVDVTGMSVSITPASTSSTVLVLVSIGGHGAGTADSMLQLVRNSTALANGNSGTYNGFAQSNSAQNSTAIPGVIIYLDSPATTSATTYKIQQLCNQGTAQTAYFNRRGSNTQIGVSSTITVMEIAG